LLANLALLDQDELRLDDAESLYLRALAMQERSLGTEHPDAVATMAKLGALYAKEGKYDRAEMFYQRALIIQEKTLGPEHPDVAATLNGLAGVYDNEGKHAEARLLYDRALGISGQNPVRANIRITITQAAGRGGPEKMQPIFGTAGGVSFAEYRVVVYARAGGIWWVQPTTTSTLISIDDRGRWRTETHLGDSYAALLVKPSFILPPRTEILPDLGRDVVALTQVGARK